MNRPANRLGIRVANRAGYLAGSPDGTESGTGPLTESPHVRAIAARPGPSRPVLTGPTPGAIPPDRDQLLNGNHPLSAVQAEVARERIAKPDDFPIGSAATYDVIKRSGGSFPVAVTVVGHTARRVVVEFIHWSDGRTVRRAVRPIKLTNGAAA